MADDRLSLTRLRVEDRSQPLHVAVAATIRSAIRPLMADRALLPRYLALSAPERARGSHLSFLRSR